MRYAELSLHTLLTWKSKAVLLTLLMRASPQYNFEALPKDLKELANALSGIRQQPINEVPDHLNLTDLDVKLTALDVKQLILEGAEDNRIYKGMV